MAIFDCLKKLISTLVIMGIVLPTSSGLAQTCGDDPRLSDLPGLLNNGTPPTPPLTMMPETFIRLHPKVRAVWGRSITICPGIALNSKGQPIIRPIKVPFPDLWEKIEACVGRDDWDEISYLHNNFVALPLPREAIFSLLTIPGYSEKNMHQLAQKLKLATFAYRGQLQFFVADAFYVFGGRVDNPGRLIIFPSQEEVDQARTTADALGQNESFVAFGGLYLPFLAQALKSLKNSGIEAVSTDYRLKGAQGF